MNVEVIKTAADLLARAWRTGERLERLPEPCRPRDAAEAFAVQAAFVDAIGDSLAGWKVAASPEHGLLIGMIVRSRVFADGAAIDTKPFSIRGLEAEIAFRFDRTLPPREHLYTREDVADAVTALPAIEIVDTRFASYEGTPAIERAADFMSNGALVTGAVRADWRDFDPSALEAFVAIDGRDQVRRVGGHPARDPLIPTIALVNQLQRSTGVAAGMIVTAGSFTGMTLAPAHCSVEAGFSGFGATRCKLVGEI
jgi:2-keto-4-pentenoate hydratase